MSEENCRRRDDQPEQTVHVSIARLQEKFLAADTALQMARRDIDHRLEEMNQLRNQINEERGQFIPRTEFYAKFDSLNESISGKYDSYNRAIESKYSSYDRTIESLQKFQWTATGAIVCFNILIGVLIHYWK